MRDKIHSVQIEAKLKLRSYLFSNRVETGTLFPTQPIHAVTAYEEIVKLLRSLERGKSGLDKITVRSVYEKGYATSSRIESYIPVINDVKYDPRSVWAYRNIDGGITYRLMGYYGHGVEVTRKEWLSELQCLLEDVVALESAMSE